MYPYRKAVKSLRDQMDGLQAFTRFSIDVQRKSLADAETLRKLAMAQAKARHLGRHEIEAAETLEKFAAALAPFHKQVPMPAAVRKFLRSRKGRCG